MVRHLVWGVPLLVAVLPGFSQTAANPKPQEVLRFTLNETPQQIVRLMGRPSQVDDSLAGYQSWQYEFRPHEQSDSDPPPAWYILIRMDNRQIVSVTRNFGEPVVVDDLFSAAETTVHSWPSTGTPKYSVRLRPLSGESLLLAMGTAKPGDRTMQLMLIRRSALKLFMPWLAEQLQ